MFAHNLNMLAYFTTRTKYFSSKMKICNPANVTYKAFQNKNGISSLSVLEHILRCITRLRNCSIKCTGLLYFHSNITMKKMIGEYSIILLLNCTELKSYLTIKLICLQRCIIKNESTESIFDKVSENNTFTVILQ